MSRPANELKPEPRFRHKWTIVWTLMGVGFVAALIPLRHSLISPDPMLERFLELAGSVLAFTFAANALIRPLSVYNGPDERHVPVKG